jgi:hypothetical protein
MKCPNCQFGYTPPLIIPAIYTLDDFPCQICKGTAVMPEDIVYDPERGKAIKADRIKRLHTLRAESVDTGIDVIELSRRERGFFRK